jgi:aldehyde:ferredoxin oxidoreductase
MGGFFIPEVDIKEGTVKFFERENQSRLAVKCQDLGVLINSLVLCMFMVDGGDWSMTDVSVDDLMLAGQRGFTVQRLNNIRDGYNKAADILPKKLFQPAKEGFRAGKTIPFEGLMKDYYALRGWDENGAPTKETMKRLNLA